MIRKYPSKNPVLRASGEITVTNADSVGGSTSTTICSYTPPARAALLIQAHIQAEARTSGNGVIQAQFNNGTAVTLNLRGDRTDDGGDANSVGVGSLLLQQKAVTISAGDTLKIVMTNNSGSHTYRAWATIHEQVGIF